VIDLDPLESGEFRADRLHRALHDFDLAHLVEMKNRLAQVNLRDVELNLVPMVSMKALQNQDAKGGQKIQQNLVVMIQDVKMVDRLMDDQKMIRQTKDDQMKDDRLMDDQSYLVDLNFRDVLPCSYSLISIEI
jgi:hypothetical protein